MKLSGDHGLGLLPMLTPEAGKHALLYTTPRALHGVPVASPTHFHLSKCLSPKGKDASRIAILVDDDLVQSANQSLRDPPRRHLAEIEVQNRSALRS